ncbi:hypothetical protein QVD17_28329 [Tagetes erecta]|uniref:Uncharacterized protein n=1 Tax=Tagetes erecta TaxID=13708 RepID=A0AAD8KA89_TARER|nr:hypothetical protein QVD17_28329 [Tagetes erecta]
MGRTPCCSKVGLHRGAWSVDEDKLLIDHIQTHGQGQWRSLPSKAGLLRCGKSCRLRWMNYLRPGIKRGNFTTEENDIIIQLRSAHGNRWSLIAAKLPGRTDNEIKNYWNAHLQKVVENNSDHSKPSANKSLKKKRKRRKLDDLKEKTTSQEKSTKVKTTNVDSVPASSSSFSSSTVNVPATVSGASSSCTIDVGDDEFDFSWSNLTPFLEVEGEQDECFLMDGCDLSVVKDDQSLMLENLYREYLNLLDHEDVEEGD